MKGKLIVTLLGLVFALMSWVPLWIVAARDPYAMPVGLGLFAFAGSFLGGTITLGGLIGLVIHALRGSRLSPDVHPPAGR